MHVFVLISFLMLAPAATETAWYEHYEQGLEHLERGAAAQAREALEAAIGSRPQPGLKIPTRSPRFVDYTPYLYLTVAAQMTGEIEAARDYLARAETAGVAARSSEGRKLLDAYRLLLRVEPAQAPRQTPTAPEKPGYADYSRQEERLSEAEYQRIQRQILSRCNLDPDTDPGGAPWYFHYELGLELAKQQDPQRSVDALIEAVARRPDSKRSTRMYGMWFVDYLPYFEIARQHAALGNRECALDALKVSAAQGEVSSRDDKYQNFLDLQLELDNSQDY